jgi:hypothetical protein
MAELQKLEFDKLGMLSHEDYFEESEIDGYWHEQQGALKRYEALPSTRELPMSEPEEQWPKEMSLQDASAYDESDPESVDKATKELDRLRGMRRIAVMIYNSPCFSFKKLPTDEQESFVLRHPDLDLQNILVDDDGNVTSILDWHEMITAPRCTGYASLPKSITDEWFPGFTVTDPPLMSWTVDHYRQIYTEARKQHGGDDSKHTYKSSMYQAAVAAVTRGGSCIDLVNEVLLQLPGLRLTDLDEFQEHLGRDWPAAEAYLEREISKLFSPDGPVLDEK